jgi:deoxyribose-phosphate aldolase
MMKNFNKYFDHTLLAPEATKEDIRRLCGEARRYEFHSVCVNSSYVSFAKEELADSDVYVTAVVGFPLGAMDTQAKAWEAEIACGNGADEIDMVMNIGAMRDEDYLLVKNDIAAVADVAFAYDAVLKVILETCLLSDKEVTMACRLAVEAGADFVKTSTGFSKSGATAHTVALMKNTVKGDAFVKASGGIRDRATAEKMIKAGADRLGTSATVTIVNTPHHLTT